MKKVGKLTALAVVLSMIVAVFSGCSSYPEGKALFDAFKKTQRIKTAETNMDLTFRISASGLSQSEQQEMAAITQVLNNANITVNAKTKQNDDGTAAKAQADVMLKAAGVGMDMSVWVDSDISSNQPNIKEVIRMPQALTATMPDPYNSKPYMVLDFNELMKSPELNNGVSPIDYSKIMKFSKDFKDKSEKFLEGYFAKFDPGFKFINDEGQKDITTPAGVVKAHVYRVKIDDASAKALISYIVNDFVKNKESRDFVKDYVVSVLDIVNISSDEKAKTRAEVEKWFGDLAVNGSKSLEGFNKTMDTLKNVKILGDKGIDIEYDVDNDGYIVGEKGTFDFVLDIAKLNAAFGDKNSKNPPTGVYSFGFDYNAYNYNINKDMNIELPALTKENSYSYMDFLRFTLSQASKEINNSVKPAASEKKITLVNVSKNNVKSFEKTYYVPTDLVIKGLYSYSNGAAAIKVNGNTASLKVGSKSMTVNGKSLSLKVTNARVIDGKIYLPVDVYQALGIKIVIK